MDKPTLRMFEIQNMMYHCYDNDTRGFYSATLNSDDVSLDVTFSQSGNIIIAYSQITNIIYHLNIPEHMKDIKDLHDGIRVDIISCIEDSKTQ